MEEHDSTYKSPKITFDDSEPGNRKVVAVQDIRLGECLLIEPYFLVGIMPGFEGTSCHYCLEEPKDLKRCSGCKYAYYCNGDHQTKDWKRGHNKECKLIAALTADGPLMVEISIMVKIFAKLVLAKDPKFREELNKFKLHEETPEFYASLRMTFGLINSVSEIKATEAQIEEMVNFYNKLKVNMKGISTYTNRRMAAGVLKDYDRINHSCEPNTTLGLLRKSVMKLVASRSIKAGEEITNSYTKMLEPLHMRRLQLESGFRFFCKCPRCVKEEKAGLGDFKPIKLDYSLAAVSKFLQTGKKPLLEFVRQLEAELPEYDYRWVDVMDNLEQVLVQLKELQVLYNLRLKFTKKYEYWFGKEVCFRDVGVHFMKLGLDAGGADDHREALRYLEKSLGILEKVELPPLLNKIRDDIEGCREVLAAGA